MNTATETEYAAFVGIDWADRKHHVCLQAPGSSKRESSVLAHRPESIAQWAQAWVRRLAAKNDPFHWAGKSMAVAATAVSC